MIVSHGRRLRFVGLLVSGLSFSTASAAWTAHSLNPTGHAYSIAVAGYGGSQGGYAFQNPTQKAGIWTGTAASWVSLHPAGASSSMVNAMSASTQVGEAFFGSSLHAAKWSGTAQSFVDLHPNGYTSSKATSVDGNVQGGEIRSATNTHAAIWMGTAASAQDLHPAGWDNSSILAIDGGAYAGWGQNGSNTYALVWISSTAVNLHPAGFTSSRAYAISGTKQAGDAATAAATHAALWSGTAGSFVDLHPAGYKDSRILGMNGTYQAGIAWTQGGLPTAGLWSGTSQSFVDLGAVLPSDYVYSNAYGVTQVGSTTYVFGYARHAVSGMHEAMVWTNTDSGTFDFSLNKTAVAGQNSVQGTITVSQPSTSPMVFTTYDNSSLVGTPSTVTLPANATTKNFQITTVAITSTINTTIYAKRGSVVRSRPLALIPLVPTAMSFTPGNVEGGQSTSCRIVINGVAGPGGRVISVFDNSPFSQMPSSVTVAPGATSVTFNISTTAVSSIKTVQLTARVSAGEKKGTYRIIP